MNFDTLFDIIIKVLSIVITALIAYALPAIKAKLTLAIGEEKTKQLTEMIKALVISAEATMNATGAEKKAYVEEQLTELGYDVTEMVSALIEEQVFNELNSEKVKEKALASSKVTKTKKVK